MSIFGSVIIDPLSLGEYAVIKEITVVFMTHAQVNVVLVAGAVEAILFLFFHQDVIQSQTQGFAELDHIAKVEIVVGEVLHVVGQSGFILQAETVAAADVKLKFALLPKLGVTFGLSYDVKGAGQEKE